MGAVACISAGGSGAGAVSCDFRSDLGQTVRMTPLFSGPPFMLLLVSPEKYIYQYVEEP